MTTLPLAPPRTYGWRTWRDAALEAGLALLIGAAVTTIEAGGKHTPPDLHTFVRNGILGLCIVALSRGLETMLSWAIEQSRIPLVLRTIIYALGAWIGFFLGLLAVATLYGAEESDFRIHSFHFIYSMTAAALISILVGFILHHNRKRNDRLKASIERLKEHEFAEKELEIARSMQQRLLPPPLVEMEGIRVAARSDAAHIVGGDFYDVLRLNDGSVAVLAADVSGKGIAASLIMASCKAVIPFLASGGDPAHVLEALNVKLCGELAKREFVAMVYAQLDPASGRLLIANAGMPDPLLFSAGRCTHLTFTGDRFPLGVRAASRYVTSETSMAAGDRLLLFSDGLPEATVDGEPLGYERVEALATNTTDAATLVDALHAIERVEIEDDVTAVVITRCLVGEQAPSPVPASEPRRSRTGEGACPPTGPH
jgi:hypothetical protein